MYNEWIIYGIACKWEKSKLQISFFFREIMKGLALRNFTQLEIAVMFIFFKCTFWFSFSRGKCRNILYKRGFGYIVTRKVLDFFLYLFELAAHKEWKTSVGFVVSYVNGWLLNYCHFVTKIDFKLAGAVWVWFSSDKEHRAWFGMLSFIMSVTCFFHSIYLWCLGSEFGRGESREHVIRYCRRGEYPICIIG